MILGLDASTSVVGWTVLSEDASFVDIGHIDLKKCESLYDRIDVVSAFLRETKKKYTISNVFIEEALMAFGKGLSMAQVICRLQRFNGFVSCRVYDIFGIQPILLNASHARKLCGIKLIRGQNTKQIVFEYVKSLNVIPECSWIYKKTGKPKDFCYDMSDAYVVALAGAKEHEST